MSASTTDILTAIKNIVTALNAESQAYLNVQGQANSSAITTATVVKSSAGRICSVSVITAGSATGMVYDSAVAGVTTKPLYVIPNAVALAPYVVNLPASFGITVVPGASQKVTVSYS